MVVPPGVEWELLVVNNNCTDATDAVIAEFTGRLPIRRLVEPVPGLSHARNRAVIEAAGEYVVWTDDDVLVAPSWLSAYADAFSRWPDGGAFGGPIAAWFPNTPPAWLTASWSRVSAAFAVIDHGDQTTLLDERRFPFGANMAFRLDVMREFPFDASRGVAPGRRLGGEEIDVVRRSIASGRPAYWVSGARVRHYIPEDRQTLAYLWRYYAADGEYRARFEPDDVTSGAPTWFGRPRYLWRMAVEAEWRYRRRRLTLSPERWVADFADAARLWGMLRVRVDANRPR